MYCVRVILGVLMCSPHILFRRGVGDIFMSCIHNTREKLNKENPAAANPLPYSPTPPLSWFNGVPSEKGLGI